MYRGRLWTMRQYAGFGTAEESNRRYHYLLSQGTMGALGCIRPPHSIGYDPDHPRSKGEVGKVGVSIATLEDMRTLFRGIDQSKNFNLDDHQRYSEYSFGVLCRGGRRTRDFGFRAPRHCSNDVLKEYVARGNYIYPPKGTLRITTDMFAWCAQNCTEMESNQHIWLPYREAGFGLPFKSWRLLLRTPLPIRKLQSQAV